MLIMSTQNYTYLHKKLLSWYKTHGRQLPWRETDDPYKILVSEIMLQQTQVSRVIDKYNSFIHHFPDVYSLAKSSTGKIIREWSGMGYNKRAVNLHKTAKIIVQNHNGEIPKLLDTLISLPGIGRYTASAVVNFAFRLRVPVVDINIKRVIGRVDQGSLFDTNKLAWGAALKYLPEKTKTGDWHQALMDLGAMVCTARKPSCESCPLVLNCSASIKFISSKHLNKINTKSPKKTNPAFAGSNRYYRGKVIEELRGRISLIKIDHLGILIKQDYSANTDKIWLENLINRLVKDGLIEKKRGMVSLP